MTAAPGWKVWTALGIVYVIWGSTYLAIRYVVESLPPLLSASARFTTAVLLLGTYLLVRRGRRALHASRRQYGNAALVGVLLLTGGNGGVTLAEERGLPSGLAALLVAAVPLWVVLLRMLDRDRPARRTLLGVGIGFVGLAVLLGPGARPGDVSLGPAAVVLGSSLLWSIGSYLATRLDMPREPLVASMAEMAAGAVGLLVVGLARHERLHPADVELSSALALLYLVVFGSLVAYTAYSWLLGVAPVSKVSTYAYVNPVVAVLLGALFVGEDVTTTAVIGGAMTVLAVAVVVSEEGRRRRAVPGEPAVPQIPEDVQGRERSSAT
ncbi:MAG: EamA family transporter [Actinobacteria bacterium]|nr:EamA family transporter [Actinomycetota bacterium]MCA1719848.1 EamA family transporter [Actinomycetota bacterium]